MLIIEFWLVIGMWLFVQTFAEPANKNDLIECRDERSSSPPILEETETAPYFKYHFCSIIFKLRLCV